MLFSFKWENAKTFSLFILGGAVTYYDTIYYVKGVGEIFQKSDLVDIMTPLSDYYGFPFQIFVAFHLLVKAIIVLIICKKPAAGANLCKFYLIL